MKQKKDNIDSKNNKVPLLEMIQVSKKYWNYLIKRWLLIVIFGLSGGVLGLVTSLLITPKYLAHLSFALVEKNQGGGLADLASSFGLSNLLGGSDNAFSGDNLLQIIQSRRDIEQTLLTPVTYKGEKKNLVEVYIQINGLRKKWLKDNDHKGLKNLSFPINQSRETFSRMQDSVLYTIYFKISKSKALSVVRTNEQNSIVDIDFESKDEMFSKLFVDKLMDETYQFYSQTRTAQSRENVKLMQHIADSIKSLYDQALYKGALISQVNVNQAIQIASVPRIKQEDNATLYGTVYAEVLKNLESLKLDMARETPIFQIIDTPRLPLKVERLGKAKGIVIGGILGGMLAIIYLLGNLYFKELIKESLKEDEE